MSVSRLRARADRVIKECDLGVILAEYGYAVFPDPYREQQFSCDLHGADHKPSARYYPETNSTYCWVCQKKRDPVDWIRAKENLGFADAVDFLERKFDLASLPWDDQEERPVNPMEELDKVGQQQEGFKDYEARVQRLLEMLTEDRHLEANMLLSFWEVFDRVGYGVAREGWPENRGIVALQKLRERVFERIGDRP